LHTYENLECVPKALTYSLTPWCRVLLQKLTCLQLVTKFPAFHGTRRFITALTSVCHLSLSWASPIQSIYPHATSWRSVLIQSDTRKKKTGNLKCIVAAMYSWQHCGTGTLSYRQPRHFSNHGSVERSTACFRHKNVL